MHYQAFMCHGPCNIYEMRAEARASVMDFLAKLLSLWAILQFQHQ